MKLDKLKSSDIENKDPHIYLWDYLKSNPIPGAIFKQNQSIGHFTVDFVCFKNKLILEADCGQHLLSDYEINRDYWLESQGFCVLRFSNKEILIDIDKVIKAITECIRS